MFLSLKKLWKRLFQPGERCKCKSSDVLTSSAKVALVSWFCAAQNHASSNDKFATCAFSISATRRESRELPRFIRARFVAIERSSLNTVMYVQASIRESPCVSTRYARYAYTQACEMKRKGGGEKKSAKTRKGRAPNSPAACLYSNIRPPSCSPYIQTYTTGYHIRTYTQPCRCLTHRLNVSFENLSRDPPGPCIAGPKLEDPSF